MPRYLTVYRQSRYDSVKVIQHASSMARDDHDGFERVARHGAIWAFDVDLETNGEFSMHDQPSGQWARHEMTPVDLLQIMAGVAAVVLLPQDVPDLDLTHVDFETERKLTS